MDDPNAIRLLAAVLLVAVAMTGLFGWAVSSRAYWRRMAAHHKKTFEVHHRLAAARSEMLRRLRRQSPDEVDGVAAECGEPEAFVAVAEHTRETGERILAGRL